MDTLSPNKNSKQSSSSSSGCSASSSTTDIKNSHKSQRLDNKPNGTRSKSFLHCLSKHLGRHFNKYGHHHHHTLHHNGQTIVYNSQEDLRSSSTDSFSLSYERHSRLDGPNSQQDSQQVTGTSSFDMSSEEPTSRTSSSSGSSRFSPEQDVMMNNKQQQDHIYITTTIYRPNSTLNCHDDLEDDYSESDSGNSSSDENEAQNKENEFNQNSTAKKSKSSPASVANTPSNSLTTTASRGLHLSRISITSSVRSIFQHISSVSASSTRSLSCSSTPLKRVWDTKCKKSHSTPSTSESTNAKSNKSSKSSNSNTRTSSTTSSITSSKKPEKKQQSILRPPMNYVYTKGMSGLYSRVPRYTVCCPYNTQQWA